MIVNTNPAYAAVPRASAFEAPDPSLTYREPHYHGFCRSCCHPAHMCCCHVRTCRKEAKELLVMPTEQSQKTEIDSASNGVLTLLGESAVKLTKATASTERSADTANVTRDTGKDAAKILKAAAADDDTTQLRRLAMDAAKLKLTEAERAPMAEPGATRPGIASAGRDFAIIGGSCCVHLSIEYMPVLAAATTTLVSPAVLVRVTDSEATSLSWQKSVHSGSTYQIRENIIATKPGAYLQVEVRNVVARVRWCELFSC